MSSDTDGLECPVCGGREFEAIVDLTGTLSAGWNTIRLTSTGLGHLDATFAADLFRQKL